MFYKISCAFYVIAGHFRVWRFTCLISHVVLSRLSCRRSDGISLYGILLFCNISLGAHLPHYYCTAADERHFVLLTNLIDSIHQVDFENLGEIAVYDLGLTVSQRNYLNRLQAVTIQELELTHPDLKTYFFTSAGGRKVRGWFAWKPVVIKQALARFPYVLYLDAGSTVLRSPIDLFKYINQRDYFLINTGPHAIEERATQTVINELIKTLPQLQQDLLLDPSTLMISPGLQGLSRLVYATYVLPVYELTKQIEIFADEGTCRLGFGAARHDQPIFSIYAYLNNMLIHPEGWADLELDGKIVRQHIHWNRAQVNGETVIYQSRWDYLYRGSKLKYLRFKDEQKDERSNRAS